MRTASGRAAFLTGVLAWSTACVPAVEPPPERARHAARPASRLSQRDARPNLQDRVLPSGLRVVLEEDPFATSAGVVSVIRGGAGDDPLGAEGLTHLVEHLTFRAVDPAPAGTSAATRWDTLTKFTAGQMNGFTTQDCLIFYEFGLPQRLPTLLNLEIARLTDPLAGVDDKAFTVERQVIGNEHLLREDPRAGGWATSALMPIVFPAPHPYARPIGGTEATRRTLTLGAAQAYAARNFRPERTTLLISTPPGTTSLDSVIGRLPPALRGDPAHAVSRMPPAPTATTPPPVAGPVGDSGDSTAKLPVNVVRRTSPLPTPELWLAWPLPGSFSAKGPIEEVVAHWVREDAGGGQLSKEEPHIRHVSASLHPGVGASVLFVRALLDSSADANKVAKLLVARVASLWARETLARPTFANFKSLAETERLLTEPTQLPRALQDALRATLGDDSLPFATPDWQRAIQGIESTVAAEFAYRHLTRDRVHAVLFSPTPVAAPPARVAAGRRSPADAKTVPEVVAGAGAWDPKELTGLRPPPLRIVSKTLPSGLTVITVPRPSASVVAWLGFHGGYSDAEPPLLVELALRTRPEANLAPKVHILPGRGAVEDMSFDTVEFLPGDLPAGLTLLFAKATTAVKEWPAADDLRRLLAPLAAAEDSLDTKAGRAFRHALFGEHPYARMLNTADVDKLSHSDVDTWIGRVHNLRNAALVVVGDVNPEDVERGATLLSSRAPGWVAELPTPAPPAIRAASAEHVTPVISDRPGSLMEIRVGCLLPQMTLGDRGHYELLRSAIDARLNTALRVEQGDGYGVNVGYERLRGGTTYLAISTFVDGQQLADSLGVLRRHWQRWAHAGFEASELNVARWLYAEALPIASGNGNALAFELLRAWNVEPKGPTGDGLRPDIGGLRAERVNELFAACKANTVLGLTGNEVVIRKALEDAWPGLGSRARAVAP